MVLNTDTTIWDRVLETRRTPLPPGAAAFLVELDFPDEDHQRMHELALKSQEGSLTADERAEYEGYVRVGHLLALMQSRARVALKQAVVNGHE